MDSIHATDAAYALVISVLSGVILWMATHLIKSHKRELVSKDKQKDEIVELAQKVIEVVKDVKTSVESNTKQTEIAVKSSEKTIDILNDIHLDIIKSTERK